MWYVADYSLSDWNVPESTYFRSVDAHLLTVIACGRSTQGSLLTCAIQTFFSRCGWSIRVWTFFGPRCDPDDRTEIIEWR